MAVVVPVVVMLGCSGKPNEDKASPQPPPPACEPTLTSAATRIAGNDKPAFEAAGGDRARLAMIASCEAEHWSADAMTCIAAARLAVDLSTCTEKLTHEQYVRLDRKLATLRIGDAATLDAGVVDAPFVATPIDAAPPPSIDAAVVVRRPVEPPIDAAPGALDCTRSVLNPRDPRCIKQFCKANPTDIKCDVLE